MENASIQLRLLAINDYKELKEAMVKAYASMGRQYWKEDSLSELITMFPEGEIAIIVDGKVTGCALSLRLNYDDFGDRHSYKEITGDYTFDTYDAEGDILYGIEVLYIQSFAACALPAVYTKHEKTFAGK